MWESAEWPYMFVGLRQVEGGRLTRITDANHSYTRTTKSFGLARRAEL